MLSSLPVMVTDHQSPHDIEPLHRCQPVFTWSLIVPWAMSRSRIPGCRPTVSRKRGQTGMQRDREISAAASSAMALLPPALSYLNIHVRPFVGKELLLVCPARIGCFGLGELKRLDFLFGWPVICSGQRCRKVRQASGHGTAFLGECGIQRHHDARSNRVRPGRRCLDRPRTSPSVSLDPPSVIVRICTGPYDQTGQEGSFGPAHV